MSKPRHTRQKIVKETSVRLKPTKRPKMNRITFMVSGNPIDEIHDHPKDPPDWIDGILDQMAPADQFVRTPIHAFMKEHPARATDLAEYWANGYEPWKDPNTGIFIIAPPRLS